MAYETERKGRTVTYLTCAETAKLVRGALKAAFPGQKFSVRSSTYAGGASIDVSWTDGPTGKQVDPVIGQYVGATFDGMIDLKSYHTSYLRGPDGDAQEVHFGADFVFGQRSITEEHKTACIPAFEAQEGPYDPERLYDARGIGQYQCKGSEALYYFAMGVAA